MTARDFDSHLKHASEVVATWPAWKQKLLGGPCVKPTKSAAQIMFEQYIRRCNGMNWSWGWERASAQERNRWRNYAKSVMREIKHQEAQHPKDTKQ